MTSIEKAKELVNKFVPFVDTYHYGNLANSKQCALISVDEIINSNPTSELSDPFLGNRTYENVNYWKDVKKEIQSL
jgi:hypothetical protein